MQQWHTRESAAEWDAGSSEQLVTRAEQQEIVLALLAAASIGDGAVLDFGVGSGLVAAAVLERLPDSRLVGIDFSPPMLDLARRRLTRFGSRVTLVRGDLSRLDRLELPHISLPGRDLCPDAPSPQGSRLGRRRAMDCRACRARRLDSHRRPGTDHRSALLRLGRRLVAPRSTRSPDIQGAPRGAGRRRRQADASSRSTPLAA
jgi:SAM-dependent methyltransferase